MPTLNGKEYQLVPAPPTNCEKCIRHQDHSGLGYPDCNMREWDCHRNPGGFVRHIWVHLPDYVATILEES